MLIVKLNLPNQNLLDHVNVNASNEEDYRKNNSSNVLLTQLFKDLVDQKYLVMTTLNYIAELKLKISSIK